MMKRRVKAPRGYHRPKTKKSSPDGDTSIYTYRGIDFEAERRRCEQLQEWEDFGNQIGIILHWLFVKPFQIIYHLLIITAKVLGFVIMNFGQITMGLWCLFFFGGIIYFTFQIWSAQ